MAALEIVALDEATPQLRAPGAGDTYTFPRAVTGTLAFGVAGSSLGAFSMSGNTSGTVTVRPAAAAGTWTFTLPTSGGTSGYFLQTDGSGGSSWAGAAGSTTQLQYNNGGAFAGTSGITTDGISLTIATGTITASKPLNVSQTWTTNGTTYYVFKADITTDLGGAGGRPIQVNVDGSEVFFVRQDGNVYCKSTLYVGSGAGTGLYNNTIVAAGNYKIGFSSDATNIFNGGMDTNIMRVAAGILGVRNGSTGGATISLVEQTAPSAPATNGVYIYAEDNGSGKTRLMALFASGAAQQIAIEP